MKPLQYPPSKHFFLDKRSLQNSPRMERPAAEIVEIMLLAKVTELTCITAQKSSAGWWGKKTQDGPQKGPLGSIPECRQAIKITIWACQQQTQALLMETLWDGRLPVWINLQAFPRLTVKKIPPSISDKFPKKSQPLKARKYEQIGFKNTRIILWQS